MFFPAGRREGSILQRSREPLWMLSVQGFDSVRVLLAKTSVLGVVIAFSGP